MKIFKTSQIKELDAFTIANEPVSSYNLMKRAVGRLFDEILPHLERERTVHIFAGPGNNGGDSLVLAKLLTLIGQPLKVYLYESGKLSADCLQAKADAEQMGITVNVNVSLQNLSITKESLIVDGLFGAGLTRPLQGNYLDLVKYINDLGAEIWSIDIPSGLMGEDNRNNNLDGIIYANKTFTFQQPKLSFFLADCSRYVGDWFCLDIGLHKKGIEETPSDFELISSETIKLKKRDKFSHKGTYGHGLLVAGQYGMAGAAIFSSRSALRTGIGLLSVHIPSQLCNIMQISVPEAIMDIDKNELYFSSISNQKAYSAVGVGPGLGVSSCSYNGLCQLLDHYQSLPFVIDADALNIISMHKDLLLKLPPKTIITPHPKEFDRLCGDSKSSYERLEKSIGFARNYNVIVVLKGAHTSIAFPDGKVKFNSTGNPGMATAGSGDVLTGIILSLLAQKYTPEDAAIYGVYLHGLAGDKAAAIKTEEALIASDLVDYLPEAIKALN